MMRAITTLLIAVFVISCGKKCVAQSIPEIFDHWRRLEATAGLTVNVEEGRTLALGGDSKLSSNSVFEIRYEDSNQIVVSKTTTEPGSKAFSGTVVECRSSQESFVLQKRAGSDKFVVDGVQKGVRSDESNLFHQAYPYAFPASCFGSFAAPYSLDKQFLTLTPQNNENVSLIYRPAGVEDNEAVLSVKEAKLTLVPDLGYAIVEYTILWSDGSTETGKSTFEKMDTEIRPLASERTHRGVKEGMTFEDTYKRKYTKYSQGPIDPKYFTIEHYGVKRAVEVQSKRRLVFVVVNLVFLTVCVIYFIRKQLFATKKA